jgi:RNA polymerase sigma factor (sigma-70 family)
VVHDAAVRVSEAEGLEVIYRREAPRLWRALVAFAGDPELASDAVAETFAQALRRGEALLDPARWVWTAAFKIATGELKDLGTKVGGPPQASTQMPDEAILMLDLLSRLPNKQRAAVVLRYYADLPDAQIARILGVTTATVRVHLSQGRKRLERFLREADDV